MTERMQQSAQEKSGLLEDALDLVIRLHEDPANPVTRGLVQDWQMRSAAHAQAWAEAAEIYGMTGKVLTEKAERPPSRRRVLTMAAAGVAGGCAGLLFGPRMLIYARADHVTSAGEMSRIRLADGTRVMLGPDGAIQARITENLRRADLLAGMAFFDVAEEKARPFQAATGALTVSARAASFDLSNDAGYLSVSVEAGNVTVMAPGADEYLSRGDYLVFDEGAGTYEKGRRAPEHAAFWRDGVIVADSEPVAAVIAKIERWQKARIVIAGTAFGGRRISGVFDLSDPAAALDAVVYPHGGTVRHISPWLIVVSEV